MASDNKNGNNLLKVPPNFLVQLIFGIFLTLILLMMRQTLEVSLFAGILTGFIIGWITEANKTGPNQPENVASSDGVEAGLKYWLFFLVGFTILGYQAPMSILLGGLGGLGGGLIIAWWGSKESSQTDLPKELIESDQTFPSSTIAQRRFRRPIQRSRRPRYQGFNRLKFWE